MCNNDNNLVENLVHNQQIYFYFAMVDGISEVQQNEQTYIYIYFIINLPMTDE